MPKPWDIPPLPRYGDVSEDETYKAVGRLISAWETVEYQLCVIHAILCEDPRGESMRLYGKERNFTGRLDTLMRAAESYFVKHPNQSMEGKLDSLVNEARAYIDRRNEIAHGIVSDITRIDYLRRNLRNKGRLIPQYAVLAPYHAKHWHASTGLPKYAYTANTIGTLEDYILKLFLRLQDFEHELCSPPRAPPAP